MSEGLEFHPERIKEAEWQAELARIHDLLLKYLNEITAEELLADVQATAMMLNGIATEVVVSLENQKQSFEYDGQLLEVGDTVQSLYDGIHYLKSITAGSLSLAYEHGGEQAVISQIEKTRNDLNLAIDIRNRYVKPNE